MQGCSSHGNMLGPCSCGSPAGSSSFSFLFAPLPSKTSTNETPADLLDPLASSSSSLVDCTLSLGTPSTRQTETTISHHHRRLPSSSSSSSCVSNLCWDIFQPKQPSSFSSTSQKGGGRSSGGGYNGNSGSCSSSARRCANCDTTSTPLWRNGPRGPKSLCNACGIRYKKEERRATSTSTMEGGSQYSQQHLMMNHQQQQWTFAAPPPQQHRASVPVSPAFNTSEFRLVEDDDGDADSSPFLSWRLSVPPPPDFPLQYT